MNDETHKKFVKGMRDYGRKNLMDSHKKRHQQTPPPNAMPMATPATPIGPTDMTGAPDMDDAKRRMK